jgi:hypothetical protein
MLFWIMFRAIFLTPSDTNLLLFCFGYYVRDDKVNAG